MGWDKRGYYYRVRKVAGRVFRKYCGTGALAELAEQLDTQERERRQQQRIALCLERETRNALDAKLNALDETADLLASAALLAAGYRQHKRGEWRKKRERKQSASDCSTDTA